MTNRRQFLQTGVSVAALPLAIDALIGGDAVASGRAPRVMLHKAAFDDRYREGRRFAETMSRLGVAARPVRDGDVTDLYQELDLLWRERPAAVGGLTQFGPMFVLERLALEHGLRMVLRVEHEAESGGTLAHRMSGPSDTLALAETLQREGIEWPALMAALATHCFAVRAASAAATITTAGGKPALMRTPPADGAADAAESLIHYYRPFSIQEGRGIAWDGPLFSWVIAPAPRA